MKCEFAVRIVIVHIEVWSIVSYDFVHGRGFTMVQEVEQPSMIRQVVVWSQNPAQSYRVKESLG